MSRATHFEIHAADPERAKAFYEKVMGWSVTKWDNPGWDYWLIGTGPDGTPGINGGMIKRRGDAPAKGQPVNSFVVTLDVADLDATLKKALKAGAETAVPKAAIPGVGWLAYIHDPEGNILGLMQADPSAK
jgi:predicted enzyme related to lactoylglutathione lyase